MATMMAPEVEQRASALRPVARWATVRDDTGRMRLAMTWSVPDPDPAQFAALVSERPGA
jgi:hypothetical protein